MQVKLLKPHTHAGRTYPAEAELTLRQDQAEWLIALKVAEAIPAAAPTNSSKKEK